MNLSSIIVLVISSYFLMIPLLIRFICERAKKRVPVFFIYGDFIKFISIGATTFVSLTRVSGDVVIDIPMYTRVYCLFAVAGTLFYYFKDMVKDSKKPKVFEDKNKCNLAYVIYESFGDKSGYDYLCSDEKLTEEQWGLFKKTFKSDLFEDNIEPFTEYVYSKERKALSKKDGKLLYKVCHAQVRYLNSDNKYTEFYSSLLNDYSDDLEEHRLIREIILNNKKLFKEFLS